MALRDAIFPLAGEKSTRDSRRARAIKQGTPANPRAAVCPELCEITAVSYRFGTVVPRLRTDNH